jgi:large subunit ribosomal protein L9
MKVILLKDIKGVGKRFEEKSVSDGYALNMLIPKKMAVPATGASAGQIKNLKESADKHKEADVKKLEAEVAKLSETEVKIALKANEKNHLFATLTAEKISELLREKGVQISSGNIVLEKPIKETGSFSVPVSIGGKLAHFTLVVEPK